MDLRLVSAPNRKVEAVVDALSEVEGLHISFFPQGVLALDPPAHAPPDRVVDVTLRSPIEIFLSGLQSIGSWVGFLGYAMVGAVVAWTGLLTNTTYLLVGAMLIAPFAGPAMNAAMATSRGDAHLFGRSVARYAAAVAVSVFTAALCTLVYQLQTPTLLMSQVSTVAATAVLLPLAAGAAGALNLAQSERSSLVSGAATGMLVAAALAPPAAVTGMALAIGEWGMAGRAAFLLVLQLVGINLAGAVVFYAVGVRSRGARFPRGKRRVQLLAGAATVVALGVLAVVQLGTTTVLERSTLAQRAEAVVATATRDLGATLLEANARFASAGQTAPDVLLVTVYAVTGDADGEALAEHLTATLTDQFDVTPYVSVTPVEP